MWKRKNTRRRNSTLFCKTNILSATPPSFAKEGKKKRGNVYGLPSFAKEGGTRDIV
jgi:hypothetical protein